MKTIKSILLSLALGLFSSPLMATKAEAPVGQSLNRIMQNHYPLLVREMNLYLNSEQYPTHLSQYKEEDREALMMAIKTLRQRKFKAQTTQNTVILMNAKETITLQITDLLTNKYKINGIDIQFNPKISFTENLNAIAQKLTHKKTTFSFSFFNEAHAVIPLIFVGVAAASAVGFFADTAVSASKNDINNSLSKEAREKIDQLKEKFKKRADLCEQDLGQTYAKSNDEIIGLDSVKAIGQLIEGLNAELKDEWFNGKSTIDYDSLGCEAYDSKKDGIHTQQVLGIVPGIYPGKIAKELCQNQERLNTCLSQLEDVLNENEITINDIPKNSNLPDAYDGIVEEYQDLSGASHR